MVAHGPAGLEIADGGDAVEQLAAAGEPTHRPVQFVTVYQSPVEFPGSPNWPLQVLYGAAITRSKPSLREMSCTVRVSVSIRWQKGCRRRLAVERSTERAVDIAVYRVARTGVVEDAGGPDAVGVEAQHRGEMGG